MTQCLTAASEVELCGVACATPGPWRTRSAGDRATSPPITNGVGGTGTCTAGGSATVAHDPVENDGNSTRQHGYRVVLGMVVPPLSGLHRTTRNDSTRSARIPLHTLACRRGPLLQIAERIETIQSIATGRIEMVPPLARVASDQIKFGLDTTNPDSTVGPRQCCSGYERRGSLATQRKRVFLSPHPDDICFSSYVSLCRSRRCAPVILDVFNKSCWSFREPPCPDRWAEVTSIRAAEERLFGLRMGAEVVQLGFEDSSLRCARSTGDEYGLAPSKDPQFQRITEAILFALSELEPFERILAPLGISNHIDHLICRDVCLQTPSLRTRTILYEDLPYVAAFEEEQISNFARSLPHRLEAFELRLACPDEKAGAMQVYESQLESHTIPTVVRYGTRKGNGNLSERYYRVM